MFKAWKDTAPFMSAPRQDPQTFWGGMSEKELDWFQKWDTVLDWSNPPFVKWFSGAKINVSYNCLDRHLKSDRRDKAAIVFEGEPGDQRIISYAELHKLVSQFANVLNTLKAGDRSIIYMPMIPEAAIAMLACARIGVSLPRLTPVRYGML